MHIFNHLCIYNYSSSHSTMEYIIVDTFVPPPLKLLIDWGAIGLPNVREFQDNGPGSWNELGGGILVSRVYKYFPVIYFNSPAPAWPQLTKKLKSK